VICIAKNHKNRILSVVLTKNIELAKAFWHGKGIIPHTITELTEANLLEHPTGVIPIVSTTKQEIYHNGSFRNFLIID